MAKSLVAAALMVAFSTPVAANTATGSHTASVAFSKQADGIVMPTDADGSNGSNNALGAIGLEYLPGIAEEDIKKAAVTSDEGLSDADPTKVFFLYNVKTGKFLNAGGYWGTHVSLKDYPLSLWAETHTYGTQTLIDFKQNMETGQDKYLGWAGKDGGTGTDDGKRVRDAAFFFIIMLVTFAATLLKPQKYVSSRTIQKCVEHVSTST